MVKVISRSSADGPLVKSIVAPTPTEPASRSRRDSALAVVLVMIFFTAAAAGFSDAVFIVVPCSLSIWPTTRHNLGECRAEDPGQYDRKRCDGKRRQRGKCS